MIITWSHMIDRSLYTVRATPLKVGVMAQEKIPVELYVSSESQTKQHLLELLGSSKILIVRSIDRAANCLHFES